MKTLFKMAVFAAACAYANLSSAAPIDLDKVPPKAQAIAAQILLKRGGFDVGTIDGEFGKKSLGALDDYRESKDQTSRILRYFSLWDAKSLQTTFGPVDEAEIQAVLPLFPWGCEQFSRGDRVEFAKTSGRYSKKVTNYFGTVLSTNGDSVRIRVDIYRKQYSSQLYHQKPTKDVTQQCARVGHSKH